MTRLKLTQKSDELLHKQFNATGVVFIKSGDNEITSFEFYRGRNGKLYLTDAMKPITVKVELGGLSKHISEDEV